MVSKKRRKQTKGEEFLEGLTKEEEKNLGIFADDDDEEECDYDFWRNT